MAGISKIGELEARKRALVTQSEICRETLKAEVENLQLHAAGFIHRFEQVRKVGPWVALAVPVVAPLIGLLFRKKPKDSRPSRLKGGIATALMAIQLFRKYGPIARMLATRFMTKRRSAGESRARAANM